MKKKLSIFLCAVLCLIMAGCTGKTDEKKDSEETTTTTTTTTVGTDTVAENYSYSAWAFNPDEVHQITDADIIKKIDDFITVFEGYTVETESRESSVDIPKGSQIEIIISKGYEKYKTLYIAASDMERVSCQNYADSEKTGYYYTDDGVTTGFYAEMTDYFRSQGWIG